jgi:hypothetical protein
MRGNQLTSGDFLDFTKTTAFLLKILPLAFCVAILESST